MALLKSHSLFMPSQAAKVDFIIDKNEEDLLFLCV